MIVNATGVQPEEIQKHVFFWMNSDPCPQPQQLKSSDLPQCDLVQQHDSFKVHQLGFMFRYVFILEICIVKSNNKNYYISAFLGK